MVAGIASFVRPGQQLRKFRVTLPGGGGAKEVCVEDRKPTSRKIVRHVEQVRDLADGRKKIEVVPVESDYTYDFAPEMRADAVRAYNGDDPKMDFAAKQLVIEDLGVVKQEEVQALTVERPRQNRNKSPEIMLEPAGAKA